MEHEPNATSQTDKASANQPAPPAITMPRETHAKESQNTQNGCGRHPQNKYTLFKAMSAYEFVNNILVGITAVFILVTATVYYYQLKEMEKATKATEKALEVNTEAYRMDQRAWIGVLGISVDPPFNGKTDSTITVTIKNTGRLPAKIKGGMNVNHSHEWPMKEQEGIIGDEQSLVNGALFSEASVAFSYPCPARYHDPEGWLDIPFLYVHGYIWYEDSIGKHVTRFCFYRKKSDPPGMSLQMCPTNNWFN